MFVCTPAAAEVGTALRRTASMHISRHGLGYVFEDRRKGGRSFQGARLGRARPSRSICTHTLRLQRYSTLLLLDTHGGATANRTSSDLVTPGTSFAGNKPSLMCPGAEPGRPAFIMPPISLRRKLCSRYRRWATGPLAQRREHISICKTGGAQHELLGPHIRVFRIQRMNIAAGRRAPSRLAQDAVLARPTALVDTELRRPPQSKSGSLSNM
ncbi:hypothetical protein PtA15_14A341 [Puccinia triticina]|uniref:Uncharacterized protein n=1 Tax=Puccinia triticina TaxID=208348 RepID=A0ABY7D5A5_9BASI|nr:uncharacterized protein PtA15_14A341 [Puccinia triticina]WAQ91457.1 hypothetical protein PtA15_14A341 [Puccinia triticina]